LIINGNPLKFPELGDDSMLSTTLVWLIWFFLFIPVLAWLLGLLLPVSSEAKQTPDGKGETPPANSDQAAPPAPLPPT
jgi:hypothetical protein